MIINYYQLSDYQFFSVFYFIELISLVSEKLIYVLNRKILLFTLRYVIGIKNVEDTKLKIVKNLRDRPEYIEELLSAIAIEHVLYVEIVDFQMHLILCQIFSLEYVHVEHFVTGFVSVLVQPHNLQLKLSQLSIINCKQID